MAKRGETKTVYVCGTTWDHDMDGDETTTVFATERALYRRCGCVDAEYYPCPVIEIECRVKRVIGKKKNG